MRTYQIAVFPGDGIGQEIVPQAVNCLSVLGQRFGHLFNFRHGIIGGEAIDRFGVPLPEEALAMARDADAILLGAVGGPKWEGLNYAIRPERALLGLREKLELYANLRPARLFPMLADASSLKREAVEGLDILVVRELTGGIYFGQPRGISKGDCCEIGLNTEVYKSTEIERIAKVAFEVACKRKRKVTSVDKANVLESSELWRRIVAQVGRQYPAVELSHMYVDNCAMQLVRNPKQFDVIVTTNLFGDILSDEAAMLTGSIGMLPSASLNGMGTSVKGMYEPIHGSAPDIAGRDIANPVATVLSAAMMLSHSFGLEKEAAALEGAVLSVLEDGYRTADIHTPGTQRVGTRGMGDRIVRALSR